MPLPIATIGLNLASLGLKMFGGESRLLEVLGHPVDILAGHLSAESAIELAERLRERFDSFERIKNEDLERAVVWSVYIADLFCLEDSLPPNPGEKRRRSQLRERFKKLLPESSSQGIVSQAENSVIRPAIADCEEQFRQIEESDYRATEIDSHRLVLPDRGGDWSEKLAHDRFEEIAVRHPNLPDRVSVIFKQRWFGYLCLAFHEQIKTNQRVSAIFQATQVATGFLRIEEVVRAGNQEVLTAIQSLRSVPKVPTLLDRYASVRAEAPNYVERIALQNHLRELLVRGGSPVISLWGIEGGGKTELAVKLCHDPTVRDAFPDGIVWTHIGRESGRSVLDWMREIAEELNDDTSYYTASNCETRYRSLLAGKAVLVVLDNVWSAAAVEPFVPGSDSPRCRLLFTTRMARIGVTTGATELEVGVLRADEARAMLAKYAGVESKQLPGEATDIIAECGSLAKGLTEIGSSLRDKDKLRWADRVEELRRAEAPELLKPTAVSVDALGEDDSAARERYIKLAVLLEGMAAPEPVLRTIWGVSPRTARKTVDELERRSLARRERGGLHLLDLQMDYVRSVYSHRDALTLIHGALRLSSHVVERDGDQFAAQVVGRLLPHKEHKGVAEFLTSITSGAPRPWLRPVQAALHPPGTSLLRTLDGHSASVLCVAITRDGRLAVSGSSDHTVKVWNLATERMLLTLEGHSSAVWGIAVSPDGRWAVSASADHTLKVWDLERGCLLGTIEGHTNSVNAVAVSGDGRRAVSVSADRTLKLWDVEGQRLLRTLGYYSSAVARVEIERWAVSLSSDGTLQKWDLNNGKVLDTIEGGYCSASMSVGDRWVVSASKDKGPMGSDFNPIGQQLTQQSDLTFLRVWDRQTKQIVQTVEGKESNIISWQVDIHGRWAVSESLDHSLKVWDLEAGSVRCTLIGYAGKLTSAAVTLDSRQLLAGFEDGAVKVWHLESGKMGRELAGHSNMVNDLAVTSDGLVVSASSDRTLRAWRLSTGELLRTMEGHSGGVSAVAMTPDGSVAVSASDDDTLKVWSLDRGHILSTKRHSGWVRDVVVSADGRLALSVSDDKTLKMWDVETAQLLRTFEGHSSDVNCVAVSSDRQFAVSGSSDKTLKVWDLQTGLALRTLDGHSSTVTGVALTPDDSRAISASCDDTLKVWDLHTGRTLQTLKGHSRVVVDVTLTPDGRRAVSVSQDNTLRVWDLDTAKLLSTLQADDQDISSRNLLTNVALTPDGCRAVTASWNGTLTVWDLEAGQLLRTLEGHSNIVTGVAVSPDGRLAVSSSYDKTLKLWNLDTCEVIQTFTCEAIALCCSFIDDVNLVAGDALGLLYFLRLERVAMGFATGQHP